MSHDSSIWIIYPDIGWLSKDTIISWYTDAVANGHIQNRHCTTVIQMAAELEDIGFLYRGRQPKEN